MSTLRFPEPVIVWLDPHRPEFGVHRIETIQDGLSALNRYRIDSAIEGPNSGLWRQAAGALVLADIEPTRSNVRKARDAFCRLVKRVAPISSETRGRLAPASVSERVAGLLGAC